MLIITSPHPWYYTSGTQPTRLTGTVTERSEPAQLAVHLLLLLLLAFKSSVRGNCQIRFGLTHIQIGRCRVDVFFERERERSEQNVSVP